MLEGIVVQLVECLVCDKEVADANPTGDALLTL